MHAICQEMTLDLRTVIVFLEIFYLVSLLSISSEKYRMTEARY